MVEFKQETGGSETKGKGHFRADAAKDVRTDVEVFDGSKVGKGHFRANAADGVHTDFEFDGPKVGRGHFRPEVLVTTDDKTGETLSTVRFQAGTKTNSLG